MTQGEELDSLCHKFDDQGELVKLIWNQNAGVPPSETFPDNAESESQADQILELECERVICGESTVVEVNGD